jgi:hypothetical protein
MSAVVEVDSNDFWVKVVGMLQQNWAVIESGGETAARIIFITDTSGIFDEIAFSNAADAAEALARNGFKQFAQSPDLQAFLRPPAPPYARAAHPNGPIYSSGRFWRS